MSVLPAFLSSVLGPVGAHRPTEAPSGTFVLADRRFVSRSPERMHLRYGPLLFIPVLALVFFVELLLLPSWVLYSDFSGLLAYQAPQMRYLVGSWQQTGELPLWCPYTFAGMPFIHDLQVARFILPTSYSIA